jgi:hypothetical protein
MERDGLMKISRFLILQFHSRNFRFLSATSVLIVLFLYSTGPSRDDWANMTNLRGIEFNYSNVAQIFTNSWCCEHERRFFFLSWLFQWPLAHLGSFAASALYLLVGCTAAGIGWKAFVLGKQLFPSQGWAEAFGFAAGWSASTLVVGHWANNLFFLLPVFFLLCLIQELFFTGEKYKRKTILVLILATEFSGESTLGLLALVLIIHILKNWKNSRERIYSFAYLGSFVVSASLYNLVVAGPTSNSFNTDTQIYKNYLATFILQEKRMWLSNGELYGVANRSLIQFLVFFFIIGACFAYATLVPLQSNSGLVASEFRRVNLSRGVAIALLIVLSIAFPMILGILTGSRTGPDYRYHLTTSLSLFCLIFTLLYKYRKLEKIILGFLVVGLTFGSASALEASSRQRDFDIKIWDSIYSQMPSNQLTALVTFNPHNNYPMPPYHSFAESDFQADWGMAGKFAWENGSRIPIYAKMECDQFECQATDYYGTGTNLSRQKLYGVVYVLSNLAIDPDKLQVEDFRITKSYEEYVKYIEKNPKIVY